MTDLFGDQSGFPRAHEEPTFLEMLHQDIAQAYARAMDLAILGIREPARQGHRLPPTPERVAAFEKWQAKFDRLHARGEREGWLDPAMWGGEGESIREPEGEWVWDESEEDFQARYDAWLAQVAPDGYIRIPTKGES